MLGGRRYPAVVEDRSVRMVAEIRVEDESEFAGNALPAMLFWKRAEASAPDPTRTRSFGWHARNQWTSVAVFPTQGGRPGSFRTTAPSRSTNHLW